MSYIDFVNAKKNERNVTWTKLSYGICDKSYINLWLKEERLPKYYLRNRVMGRLGIDTSQISCYLSSSENQRFNKRREILFCYKNREFDSCLDLIDKYESEVMDDIDAQFVLDIRASVFLYNGNGKAAKPLVEDLLNRSIPGVTCKNICEYEVSQLELMYVYKKIFCRLLLDKEKNSFEIMNEFEMILTYIAHKFTGNMKALLYSIYTAEYVKTAIRYSWKSKDEILKYINKALNILAEEKCLCSIMQLLLLKRELVSDIDEIVNIDRMLEGIKILKEYGYSEDGILLTSDLYMEFEAVPVAEVVRNRRITLGLTQKEVAKDICSVRTLNRWENEKADFGRKCFSELLDRLYLPSYVQCLDREYRNRLPIKRIVKILKYDLENHIPIENLFFTEYEIKVMIENLDLFAYEDSCKIQQIIENSFEKGYVINKKLKHKYCIWKTGHLKGNQRALSNFAKKALYYNLKANSATDIGVLLRSIELVSTKLEGINNVRRKLQIETLLDFYAE